MTAGPVPRENAFYRRARRNADRLGWEGLREDVPIPMPTSGRPWERHGNCKFMGWSFTIDGGADTARTLICDYLLLNPESPGLVLSYRNIHMDRNDYRREDGSIVDPITWACAWLIAHWWDHYAASCPCVGGNGLKQGGSIGPWFSNFGYGVFNELLESGEEAQLEPQ